MVSTFVENVKQKIQAKSKPKNPNRKPKKPKKKPALEDDSGPGTVYLAHIPHGFYEEEMTKYFSQFGKILKLRLARSRKTGNPKGFAYIQFVSEAVAKIVAESMNNYLFFEKLLKCEFIPADKLHEGVFNGWKGKYLASDRHRLRQNRFKKEEKVVQNKARRLNRLQKLKTSLMEKGIDFKVKPFVPKKV